MIRKRAYAKINLSMDVLSKRDDNYHNIDTVITAISLYDDLSFEKLNSGFKLKTENLSLKTEENLIYKAYKAVCEHIGRELGVAIELVKRIPKGAGLGGGTSDAITTLYGIDELYDLNLSEDEFYKLALSIGMDGPYFLKRGTVRARSRGEELEFLKDFEGIRGIIVSPGYEISTAKVYQNLEISDEHIDMDHITELISKRDVSLLKGVLKNAMEKYVFNEHEDLLKLKKALNAHGGVALLSGTGSTVFALFKNLKDLNAAYDELMREYDDIYVVRTGGLNGDI